MLATVVALHGLYLIGDRTWWGEWVSIWPPIGWLVLLLPLTIRTRSWGAAGLAVLLVALYSDWPRLGRAPAPHPDAVRFAIWNVSGRRQSWEHLQTFDADLILVQESAGPPPSHPEWKGYEWFASLDPGVLTRHPAKRLPTRRVGPWTEPLLLLVELPGGRKLLVANVRLVLPSSVIWVAGGFRGSPRDGFDARVGQYAQLAALLKETMAATDARSALVAGDFNSPARMPSFRTLRAFLVDAWKQGGRGWGATATADLPLSRIDQCWLTPDIEVIDARVQRMPISDHRLFLVDVRVPFSH